jgi:hypothetical protein
MLSRPLLNIEAGCVKQRSEEQGFSSMRELNPLRRTRLAVGFKNDGKESVGLLRLL